MIPVITAIVAAGLAAAGALYRERRLELRRLLVAARVLRALFVDASKGIGVLADADGPADWKLIEITTAVFGVAPTWTEHRDTLAGHLSRDQWDEVSWALTMYFVATTFDRESPVADSRPVLASVRDQLVGAAETLSPYCVHAGFLRNPGRTARRISQ